MLLMSQQDNSILIPSHQLAEKLTRKIRDGELKPGERIGSLRDLAIDCGCTLAAVRNAFKILAEENLVISRHGSGTFVNPAIAGPQLRKIGFITSYGQQDIENYFEPLFSVASANRIVPMITLIQPENWKPRIKDLLAAEPESLLIDVEGRMVDLNELKKLCRGIPVCFCHRWEWTHESLDNRKNAIIFNYHDAYAEGLRRLLDHGHHRIAIAVSHRQLEPFKQQEIEYALKSNSLSLDSPEILLVNRENMDDSPAKVAAALKSYAPTAVLAISDYIIYRLSDIYPDIEQIERIGLFNTHYSRMKNHEFSSFNLDFEKLWTKALDPEQHGVQYLNPEFIERQNINKQAIAV